MKKELIYLSAACAFLCSCSNDDNGVATKDNGVMKALAVSSASMDAFATRAGSVTELATDGAAIGMFLKDDPTNGYVAADNSNIQYVYTAANTPKWGGATPADVIYLNNNDAQVCAYYPYDAAVTDPAAVALTSQENLVDGSKDLCYSYYNTANLNNANNQIALTMQHAYSKITFSITRDESYASTCAVTNIKIEDAANADSKILPSATLDITGVQLYTFGTAGAVDCPLTDTTPVYDGITDVATPEEASLLMVPVIALDASTKFSFTVDGNVMSTTLNTSATDILHELLPGTNYKINVTIKGRGLQVTKVDIVDWLDNEDLTDPLEPTIDQNV